MLSAEECRNEAQRYQILAWEAKSAAKRDHYLKMIRSYELLARSADFGTSLDEVIARIWGPAIQQQTTSA